MINVGVSLQLPSKTLLRAIQIRVAVSRVAALGRYIAGEVSIGSRHGSARPEKPRKAMAAVAVRGGVDEIAAEPHKVGVLAGQVQLVLRDRRCRKALLYGGFLDLVPVVVSEGHAARRGH